MASAENNSRLLGWNISWDVSGYMPYLMPAAIKIPTPNRHVGLVFSHDAYNKSALLVSELVCALAIESGRMGKYASERRLDVVFIYEDKRDVVDVTRDGLFVLWDQSGRHDDIALIKSHEIELHIQRGDEYLDEIESCRVVPKLGQLRITGERAEKIATITKVGLFEKLQKIAVKPDDQDYHPPRPSVECLRELVDALTFGHHKLALPREFSGYSDYPREPSIEYYEAEAVELMLGGYVESDDDTMEAAMLYREIDDIIELWESAFEKSGVPFMLKVDEGAGMFEDDPGASMRTNVRSEGIRAIGSALGIDSMVDAYFEGVSLEDIMA